MKIKSLRKVSAPRLTLDISVADTETYQLSNGAVVHNTTSKLFGLSEGWHLPSMSWYMRWVQFRNDDHLVKKYEDMGYPSRQLQTYDGTTIIGFPTEPVLASLGLNEKLVTASDATPEEQYKWIMLGEKYFIEGVDEENTNKVGNQISYTLKYRPNNVSFKDFTKMLLQYQPQIRCCSVMPQVDMVSYEYQPEEPITKAQYEQIMENLRRTELGNINQQKPQSEDIELFHIDCNGGVCPVDFKDIK